MARLPVRFGISRYEADEYYRTALGHYRKHDLSEAILNINYALSLLPNSSEYHATRGFFYLEDGVKDRAEVDFDEALRRNAFEVLANYGKGIMAYERKDWKEALAYFMKAWAAESTRPETFYYIAMTHHRLHENEKAKAWMEQARALFEKADDKPHLRDTEKWLSEFDKLIRK